MSAVSILALPLPVSASAASFYVAAQQGLQPLLWSALAMLAVVYILFLSFRNRKKPAVQQEASPPDGAAPSETGYILHGTVTDTDVASLFMYWAQKGYIAVCAGKQRGEVALVKLREPDESAALYEKLLLNELFREEDELVLGAPRERLRTAWKETKKRIRAHCEYADETVYTRVSLVLQDAVCAMAAFPAAAVAAVAGHEAVGVSVIAVLAGALVFFPGYACNTYYAELVHTWRFRTAREKRRAVAGWIGWALALQCAVVLLCRAGGMGELFWWLIPAGGVLTALPAPHMRQYTERGQKLHERLLGLRQALEQDGAAAYQHAPARDEKRFFETLPYAYALGAARAWAARFENTKIHIPEWMGTRRERGATLGECVELLLRMTADLQRNMTRQKHRQK